MQQYKDLILDILQNGTDSEDRTGVGTRSVFGRQMRFDLDDGFPLVTLKFTPLRVIFVELAWYLRGETNIKFLQDRNVTIWDKWADVNGELGPVYGKQWRDFNGTDQLLELIEGLKTNPNSRRHIISAWNPSDLVDMALPPCHAFVQFYVKNNKLSCQLYQRSCDVFLGLPFNIACYSLLTHILAKICGYQVGDFVWTGGDVHLYNNHMSQVTKILNREPKRLPKLVVPYYLVDINQIIDEQITFKDFRLENYNYHPKIEAPVAV